MNTAIKTCRQVQGVGTGQDARKRWSHGENKTFAHGVIYP